MTTDPINFKFSLLPGDLIQSLAGIREVCRKFNRPAHLHLGLGLIGFFYEGAKHPDDGILLQEHNVKMLKPLLLSQDWIVEVSTFTYRRENEGTPEYQFIPEIDQSKTYIDLDMMVNPDVDINKPYGCITRWPFYIYPEMACDISKPWLFVPTNDMVPPNTIIINRTERYRNEQINYSFLKPLESRLLFAGLDHEWRDFSEKFNLKIPLLRVNDFLELAIVIKSSSFFIGNQSLCMALAEAIKVPRILEACDFAPCNIPTGEKAYDFYYQRCFESYVRELAG